MFFYYLTLKLIFAKSCTYLLIYFVKLQNLNIIPAGTTFDIKACVHYFLSNFYFLPNDSPLKAMNNVFYFI